MAHLTDEEIGAKAPAVIAEWQAFKKLVYGGSLSPEQNTECRRSFLAGMHAMFRAVVGASEFPEEMGERILATIDSELQTAAAMEVKEPNQKDH